MMCMRIANMRACVCACGGTHERIMTMMTTTTTMPTTRHGTAWLVARRGLVDDRPPIQGETAKGRLNVRDSGGGLPVGFPHTATPPIYIWELSVCVCPYRAVCESSDNNNVERMLLLAWLRYYYYYK